MSVDLKRIAEIIAEAIDLPAFYYEADNFEIVRIGNFSKELLTLLNVMMQTKDKNLTRRKTSKGYKLLLNIDEYEMSFLNIVHEEEPRAYAIFGPFFYQERNEEMIRDILMKSIPNQFTERKLTNMLSAIPVRGTQFVQAWGQIATAILGALLPPYVKVNTIRAIPQEDNVVLSTLPLMHEESQINTSYRFQREIYNLVMQGNKEMLKKLIIPRTDDAIKNAWSENSRFRQGNNTQILRRIKNLTISTNTIFRMAADNSGLSPVLQHAISEEVISRIETSVSEDAILRVLEYMIESYCNAINNAFLQNHSMNIVRVQKYVMDHISEELPLEQLGEVARLNPSYLSRLFKRECHMTIHEYITKQKINEAKWLLESTDMPIQEVGAAIGFPDQSYFSTVFTKNVAMTPSAYRKNYGNVHQQDVTLF